TEAGMALRRRIRAWWLVVAFCYLCVGVVFLRTERPWIVLTRPDYWTYVSSSRYDVEAFHGFVGDLLLLKDFGFRFTPSAFRCLIGDPDWYIEDDTGTYYVYKEDALGTRIAYVDFPGDQLRDFQPNSDPQLIHERFRPFADVEQNEK
ncbi:MAG: hypothetical protein JSV78_00435, partial [Phycisphaerales bacterium]